MSAQHFRSFGYCGHADTCRWCGRKLRHLAIPRLNPEWEAWNFNPGPGPSLPPPMTIASGVARLGGAERDGLFCGIRCGYSYGLSLARKEKSA